MQRFAELWTELERAADPEQQHYALERYFRTASPADAAWALRLLYGQRPQRLMTSAEIGTLARRLSDLPLWLYAAGEAAAADPLDAAALLLGQPEAMDGPPLHLHMQRLLGLRGADSAARRAWAREVWPQLSVEALRLTLRLTAGRLRRRVRQGVLARALAAVADRPAWLLARALAEHPGDWDASGYRQLLTAVVDMPPPAAFSPPGDQLDPARPPSPAEEWCVLPSGQGQRVLLMRRLDRCLLWSDEGEFLQAPAVARAGTALPEGTVLEGELLHPGRGAEARFAASDLLEQAGEDLRPRPLAVRRQRLANLLAPLAGGPIVPVACLRLRAWSQLPELWRQAKATGLRLCRWDAPLVPVGADRWLRYQPPAATVETVLLYARLDGPVPELSLAVRDGAQLVPIARVAAQLPPEQQQALLRWIRQQATERFGPVRMVPPAQVFTLRFRAVRPSRQHKAGLVLEQPEIEAWHQERALAAVDELRALTARLPRS